MNASDRLEIERYYANLSAQIRLFGAEHLGRQYVVVRLARMEVTSPLDFSDIQRILGRVIDLRTWYPAWHREAEEAERMAGQASEEGRRVSAADLYLRASACHHWGQYLALSVRVVTQEDLEGDSG